MAIAETEPYTETAGADAAAGRADERRRQALRALERGDVDAALVLALLALESRVDEAIWRAAQSG